MEFLFPAVLFNFRCAAFLFYQTQARESYTSERYCWEKSKEGVTYKKFSSEVKNENLQKALYQLIYAKYLFFTKIISFISII